MCFTTIKRKSFQHLLCLQTGQNFNVPQQMGISCVLKKSGENTPCTSSKPARRALGPLLRGVSYLNTPEYCWGNVSLFPNFAPERPPKNKKTLNLNSPTLGTLEGNFGDHCMKSLYVSFLSSFLPGGSRNGILNIVVGPGHTTIKKRGSRE